MAVTRTLAPIAVVGIVLGVAFPALAATVVLIKAPHPSAISSEATVRLRGELTAGGFDVTVVESPPNEDPRAFLEEQAAVPGVEAVVAILAEAPTDIVELWVIDRVTGKTVTRRLPAEPTTTRSAEVLSIRALELLRASFLEIALGASRAEPETTTPPPPPPPEVARMTEVALDNSWPRTWAVEAGGCLLGSFEGFPPSLAPVVRGERIWRDRLVARLTIAGLGTPARVDLPVGSASVSQTFGLVEVGVKLRPEQRLRLFLSLGAGVLHVTAEGHESFPYQALSDSLWTPIADAGAGVRVALRGRFELAAEVHAQFAQHYPAIHFFDDTVARSGRPTVIGSLTLVAWL
jgi:hypothetical protein